jgi:hypothetical protein
VRLRRTEFASTLGTVRIISREKVPTAAAPRAVARWRTPFINQRFSYLRLRYVPSTSSWHVKQQPTKNELRGAWRDFSQVIGDCWAISQNQSTKLRRSRRRPKSTTDEGLPQPSQLVRPAGPRRATRCDLWRAQYLLPLCLPAAFALFDLRVWSLSQC